MFELMLYSSGLSLDRLFPSRLVVFQQPVIDALNEEKKLMKEDETSTPHERKSVSVVSSSFQLQLNSLAPGKFEWNFR